MTRSTFANRKVGLPASRSTMKRTPTLAAGASWAVSAQVTCERHEGRRRVVEMIEWMSWLAQFPDREIPCGGASGAIMT